MVEPNKKPKIRAVKAWALVSDTGRVDPESIRVKKSDVPVSMFDEENGYLIRRVLISEAVI